MGMPDILKVWKCLLLQGFRGIAGRKVARGKEMQGDGAVPVGRCGDGFKPLTYFFKISGTFLHGGHTAGTQQ